MENSLEKQIGKPTQISMKVILAQEVNSSTKIEDTSLDQTPEPKIEAESPKEEPILNADKTIEYVLKDKLALSKAHLVDFSFSYSSNSAQYIVDATAEGEENLSKDIKSSIESVLENELNRKIVVNIQFDLKPLLSESTPPRTSLPEPDIYKP